MVDRPKLAKLPYPADTNLKQRYPWSPTDWDKFVDSQFFRTSSGPALKAGIRLRAAAWRHVPTGSLPADETELTTYAFPDFSDLSPNDPKRQEYLAIALQISASWLQTSANGLQLIFHPDLVVAADYILGKRSKKQKAQKASRDKRLKNKHEKAIALQISASDVQSSCNSSANDLQVNRDSDKDSNSLPPKSPETGGLGKVSNGSSNRQGDPVAEMAQAHREVHAATSFETKYGVSAKAMHEALWAACSLHQGKLDKHASKLEQVTDITALLDANSTMNFREDVLPAIQASIAGYTGNKLLWSWKWFEKDIKRWHDNRIAGKPQAGQVIVSTYDPKTRPHNWWGMDEGVPPQGHPWQKRFPWPDGIGGDGDRKFGGHWDWEWFDEIADWQKTGREWNKTFHGIEPGYAGSECPTEIRIHFGIPYPRRASSELSQFEKSKLEFEEALRASKAQGASPQAQTSAKRQQEPPGSAAPPSASTRPAQPDGEVAPGRLQDASRVRQATQMAPGSKKLTSGLPANFAQHSESTSSQPAAMSGLGLHNSAGVIPEQDEIVPPRPPWGRLKLASTRYPSAVRLAEAVPEPETAADLEDDYPPV